jgi:hypothetical protein
LTNEGHLSVWIAIDQGRAAFAGTGIALAPGVKMLSLPPVSDIGTGDVSRFSRGDDIDDCAKMRKSIPEPLSADADR